MSECYFEYSQTKKKKKKGYKTFPTFDFTDMFQTYSFLHEHNPGSSPTDLERGPFMSELHLYESLPESLPEKFSFVLRRKNLC